MMGNILDISDGNSNDNEGTIVEKDQDLLIESSNMEQTCEANKHLGALDANDDKESLACHTKFDTISFINLLVEFQNHLIRFVIFIAAIIFMTPILLLFNENSAETQNLTTEYKEKPCEKSDKNWYPDRYAFGDIGKGYCPNDYRNVLNATQCEIAAILLGFTYVNELDPDDVQPLRSASSCKFCGSCIPKTVSMANGDGNETVSICQWRYHDESCTIVNVGRSSAHVKRSKTVVVNEGFTCPKKVDKDNWIGGHSYNDKFAIIQIGKIIQVTRTDSNEGWAMNLKIKCCR